MEPLASLEPGRPLRVLLVGDDPLARSGLAALLASVPSLALVGQAAPGEDTAAVLAETAPDVVLWDLGPRPQAPLEAPEETLAEGAAEAPPLLALAPDEETAADALAAFAQGALLRDAGADRIAVALRALAQGLIVLDEGAAALLLRPAPPSRTAADSDSEAEADAPIEPLTPREIEVLELLSQGLSNKLIGSRLGISEHTAKFHVNAILGKLGAQSRTDAVVRAARLGLLLL